MGGLEVLNDCMEHRDTIGFVDIVGEEHVDVFSWDNGRIEQRLMKLVAHGRRVRCCFRPVGDVAKIVIVFEGIELGEEELTVTGATIPCWKRWARDGGVMSWRRRWSWWTDFQHWKI